MKLILALVLALALVVPALAQDTPEEELNNRQLRVIRIRAMLDYARATFLFQSERFNNEQTRLQDLIDQHAVEINRLTKQIETTVAPESEPKPKP